MAQILEEQTIPGVISEFETLCHKYLELILKQAPDSHVAQYIKRRQLSPVLRSRFLLGYSGHETVDILKALGYSPEEIIAGGIGKHDHRGVLVDRFAHRLIFPIKDRVGRTIGFGGRDVTDQKKAKYINSPAADWFQKNRVLYNVPLAFQDFSTVTLMEGYLDVIRMAEHLRFEWPVAVLGTALTQNQIQLLIASNVKRVQLAFDNDWAGWVALARSVTILNDTPELGYEIIVLHSHKDWDEALRDTSYEYELLTAVAPFVFLDKIAGTMPTDLNRTQRIMISNALYPHVCVSERYLNRLSILLDLTRTEIMRGFENKHSNTYFLHRGYNRKG